MLIDVGAGVNALIRIGSQACGNETGLRLIGRDIGRAFYHI